MKQVGRQYSILCYGDSNTWGFDPFNGTRFSVDIRWPGVLGRCLGEGYTVFEEGLNGRTLCALGMEGDLLNGAEYLGSVLEGYKELDLLIFYLGINDLFADPDVSVPAMTVELEESIEATLEVRPSLQLLLLSPLPVNVGHEYHDLYHEQIEKSFSLSAAMKQAAERKGCHFLDPSQIISASRHDGVHIEAEEHIKLGLHLCTLVRDIRSNCK